MFNKYVFLLLSLHRVYTLLHSTHLQIIHSFKTAVAAKSLQTCPTLCDPTDGTYQAPPSLGFSRQEHWSGLPFPSPRDTLLYIKYKQQGPTV